MQKEGDLPEIPSTQSPPVPRRLLEYEIDEATNQLKLKLDPYKILQALGYLRMDIERIKEVHSGESKAGGQGTVVPCILVPAAAADVKKVDEATPHFVAVKKIIFEEEQDCERYLTRFAYELQLLSDLSHKNVVTPLGFVENAGEGVIWMVFIWEPHGNMREFVSSARLELPERISLVNDVARGLAYLHGRNPPICHGDLKSLNILINKEFDAVITDFGSARAIVPDVPKVPAEIHAIDDSAKQRSRPDSSQTLKDITINPSRGFLTLTGQHGTLRWSAPELLEYDHFNLATDIWAFGWIGWEAVTGNFPFHDEDPGEDIKIIVRVIQEGKLPALRNDAEMKQMEYLCNVMQDCWNLNPARRPSAQECEVSLRFMTQTSPRRRVSGSTGEAYSSGLLRTLAIVRRDNGKMDAAMAYAKRALAVAEATDNHADLADAYKELGTLHHRESRNLEAEECLVRSRDTYSQLGDRLGMANAVRSLGDLYTVRDDYAKAEESYVLARDTYSQIGNRLGMANAVKCLGDMYRMRDDYTKAEESYILARDTYFQIGDRLGMAHAVRALGDVYRSWGDYAKAEESYVLARDTFTRIGDRLGMADAVDSLGDMYRARNDYAKAEESYVLARDTYSQIGNRLGMANVVRSLGDVYKMRHDYGKAEESYALACDTHSQIGNRLGMANAVRSLGHVYRMRDDYAKAEESYVLACDTYSQIGDRLGIADTLRSLGDVHRVRNNYTKAEESFALARDTYSQMGNQLGMANSVKSLGDPHATQDDYAKAEESYVLARDTFTQIGNQLGMVSAVGSLGDVYRMRNDYVKAEEFYVLARDTYSEIGDQLGMAKAVSSLGDVYRMRHDYAKAEVCYVFARDTFTQIGHQVGMANVAIGLGALRLIRQEYTEAEAFFLTARDIGSSVQYQYALDASALGLRQVTVNQERNDRSLFAPFSGTFRATFRALYDFCRHLLP